MKHHTPQTLASCKLKKNKSPAQGTQSCLHCLPIVAMLWCSLHVDHASCNMLIVQYTFQVSLVPFRSTAMIFERLLQKESAPQVHLMLTNLKKNVEFIAELCVNSLYRLSIFMISSFIYRMPTYEIYQTQPNPPDPRGVRHLSLCSELSLPLFGTPVLAHV